MATLLPPSSVYNYVQTHYTRAAQTPSKDPTTTDNHNNITTNDKSNNNNNNDKTYTTTVATAFGYTPADLHASPADSNLGLSCGNPLALASLQPGETVIDLGCGAGFDVFQAARKVGPEGKVIGVDMNEAMLERARAIQQRTYAALAADETNIDFLHANITAVPAIPSDCADVIISNCVINLVPHADKPAVFREMYRLLRPGGRVAISDILMLGEEEEMPEKVRGDLELFVGCIGGGGRVGEWEGWLGEVGFDDVQIVADGGDLNIYKTAGESGEEVGCCGSKGGGKSTCGGGGAAAEKKGGAGDIDLNEFAGSFKIYAVKPEK